MIQSEKLAASEMHARQDVFLQITRNVRDQLGTIGGLLFLSSQGTAAGGEGTVTPRVDADFIIRDALTTSSHGPCYRLAKRHQANAPDELADPAVTGIHINF